MKEFIAQTMQGFKPLIRNYSAFNDDIILLELKGDESLKDIKELPGSDPIRMKSISFMVIEDGFMDININYRKYRIEADMVLHVDDFHIIQDAFISSDLKAWLLFIRKEFIPEVMIGERPFPVEYILSARNSPQVKLESKQSLLLIEILKRLQNNIGRTDHLFRSTLVINDFSSFSMELGHMIHKLIKQEVMSIELARKEKVMRDFVLSLNKYAKTEHAVSFYADRLCMSSQNLTRIVKEATGETVNKWIARVIITEARILLKNKALSIQEIAAELNFADQASFSKFFKKHMDVSPQVYRQRKR